jgi:hypothetical protein
VSEALAIFITGLCGVFLGMGLLFVAIKITSLLTDRWGGNWGNGA